MAVIFALGACSFVEEQIGSDDADGDTATTQQGENGGEDGSGGDGNGGDGADGDDRTPAFDPSSSEPPVLTFARGDIALDVEPFSWCWSPPQGDDGICADGFAPDPLPGLPGEGPITLLFPVDFDFTLTWFNAETGEQLGSQELSGSPQTGWDVPVPDALPARVEVFGTGSGGDVIGAFALSS